MKKNIKNIVGYLAAAIVVSACNYDFPAKDPNTIPTAGEADFTKYVAVGNSITSGYMNGALYEEGQRSSFANILATQVKPFNNNADFNAPILPSDKGGFGGFVDPGTNTIPYGRLYLKYSATCDKSSPSPRPVVPGNMLVPFDGDKTTLNNLGVPGLKLVEAVNVPNYALYNPFYARFGPADKGVIQFAAEQQATFFSMWLGANDVLAYALSGGTGSENGTNPSDMTPVAAFTPSYTGALTAMLGTSAKGVVANVPDVTSLPHFTTINPNIPTFLLDDATAAGLNGLYGAYGYSTPDGSPLFTAGVNNFVITVGADADKKVRQFDKTKDFFLLTTPTDSLGTGALVNACGTTYGKRAGWGVAKFASNGSPTGVNPIADKWILDADEVAAIKARTTAFNSAIAAAVEAANGSGTRVALVDANKLLSDLAATGATGISINGIAFTSSIVPPYGAFSLDGVHPNPRGHAYIANAFIAAINEAFNARITTVNPNDYKGNELPTP